MCVLCTLYEASMVEEKLYVAHLVWIVRLLWESADRITEYPYVFQRHKHSVEIYATSGP